MSRLTLDEAIKHCLEQARTLQDKADTLNGEESRNCMECAADHIQLAEWLRDFKKAKRLLGEAMRTLNDSSCNKDCHHCKWNNGGCEMNSRFAWKYGDEAMELLNKEAEDDAGEQ